MTKQRFILMYLLMLITALSPAQDNLAVYLQTAGENNPGVKAAFTKYLASLEALPQAKSLPDPQLAFGYFLQPVKTANGTQNFKVSLTQMFPWFGTLKQAEKVKGLQTKAAYENFQEAKLKLYSEVKKQYYDLWFIRQKIKLTQENINSLNRFRSLAEAKISTGKAGSIGILRADMKLNETKNTLKLWQDDFKTKLRVFRNLLNVDDNFPVEISQKLPKRFLPELAVLKKKLTNNHLLQRQNYLIEKQEARKKLAQKKSLPKLLTGLDYINTGTPDFGNDALMVKVGISLPVFQKKYKALIREADLNRQASVYTKMDIDNNLDSRLEQLYTEYLDAVRRIDLYQKQKNLALRATNLLQSQYSTGHQNFEEILRMQQSYLHFAIQHEKAVADKQKAIASIDLLIGQ